MGVAGRSRGPGSRALGLGVAAVRRRAPGEPPRAGPLPARAALVHAGPASTAARAEERVTARDSRPGFLVAAPHARKGVERSHQVSLCSWFRTVQVPAETRRGQCRGPVGRRGGAAGRRAPGCPAESAARAARARSASAARVQPAYSPRFLPVLTQSGVWVKDKVQLDGGEGETCGSSTHQNNSQRSCPNKNYK